MMTDSDKESVKSGDGGSKANKNIHKVKKGGKSATSDGATGGSNILTHRDIPLTICLVDMALSAPK